MFKFIQSPEWFFGIDSTFEIVTTIVCISIALFAFRIYNLTNERNYKLLALGFTSISLSYFIKAIINLKVFISTQQLTQTIPNEVFIKLFNIYQLGHLSYRLLYIIGLILLIILALNIKNIQTISIITILTIISIAYSYNSQHIFHIVSATFLYYIFNYFLNNYKNKKTKTSLLVTISFGLQLISQILLIFTRFDPLYYVVSVFIMFIGYVALSYYIILVSK
jgi:hypothetical protein